MLRAAIIVIGGSAIAGGAVMLFESRWIPGIYLLLLGAATVLGIVFERWRYRPQQSRPDARWQRTGERFEDPHTGRIVEVFYDPRSGERRYASDAVAEPDHSAPDRSPWSVP